MPRITADPAILLDVREKIADKIQKDAHLLDARQRAMAATSALDEALSKLLREQIVLLLQEAYEAAPPGVKAWSFSLGMSQVYQRLVIRLTGIWENPALHTGDGASRQIRDRQFEQMSRVLRKLEGEGVIVLCTDGYFMNDRSLRHMANQVLKYPSRGPRSLDIGSLRRAPVVREALPTADGHPSPLLWGMIRDAWLREIEVRVKQANCVLDPSSPLEDGPEMAAVVDVLYRAMVAWTGPGGSDAFLEMFALSEVRLPPLWFASSLRFLRSDCGSDFFWREHQHGIPHGFSEVCPDPLTSTKKVGSTPWRDEILGRLHREGGSGLWSAVLLPSVRVPLLRTLDALQGEYRWITGVAAPGFLYRESLLVELAQPWMMPAEIPPSFFVPG